MPIEFRCTKCGSLLRTPDGSAGRTAQCPQCGAQMPIPGPQSAEPSPAESFQEQQPADSAETSPFGQPGSQAADQTNPYASPSAYSTAPGYGAADPAAASRVATPATILIVLGFVGIPFQLIGIAGNLFQIALVPQMAQGQPGVQELPPEFQVFSGGLGVVAGIVSLILTAVMIIGAFKMKKLEHYGWAMAAAIIAVIPCFSSCCCLIEMPVGIWALVVLSDPWVKAAFRA